MIKYFYFVHTFIYRTNLTRTYKRMYYLVSIDKRKAYYKEYYQQNKERYKQRYSGQKLKLKEHEPSNESNELTTTLSILSKL